jgi:hypothetical protein
MNKTKKTYKTKKYKTKKDKTKKDKTKKSGGGITDTTIYKKTIGQDVANIKKGASKVGNAVKAIPETVADKGQSAIDYIRNMENPDRKSVV